MKSMKNQGKGIVRQLEVFFFFFSAICELSSCNLININEIILLFSYLAVSCHAKSVIEMQHYAAHTTRSVLQKSNDVQ